MDSLLLLIPLLPFIGFLINGLARNILPKAAVSVIGSGTVLGSFLISLVLFLQKDFGTVSYFDFIHVDTLRIPFSFQIDPFLRFSC
jgi:NADH-quinone oxidoreductase subunit L